MNRTRAPALNAGSLVVPRFLSYVDDGTIIIQSPSLEDNCAVLRTAYREIFRLFAAFALVLEHDKTELFHFDRSNGFTPPVIDLGYAPYTGDTPLKAKATWRYLGFYFDCKLSFQEHVCHYSTKALTTVMAMRMLGNSTRGLAPKQRRLLYRSCVVPIATYGLRLWYFDGARCKGNIDTFAKMQRKAALWISGAFSTTPGGAVEAIAGLLPVPFLLKRMATRSLGRLPSLSANHPLCALLSRCLRTPHLLRT